MTEYTTYEKMRCADREAKMRRGHYKRLIEFKRMEPAKAEYQISVMNAIADDYHARWKSEGGAEPTEQEKNDKWGLW
jgi:hypothetical protein